MNKQYHVIAEGIGAWSKTPIMIEEYPVTACNAAEAWLDFHDRNSKVKWTSISVREVKHSDQREEQ